MRKLMAWGVLGFVVTCIVAATLMSPAALTKHERTSFNPSRLRIERNGGAGAITETLAPPAAYEIHWIMVHFTAGVSTNDLTITLDSVTSSTAADSVAHDVLLHTVDLSSTTDIIWQPDSPYTFLSGEPRLGGRRQNRPNQAPQG